MNDFIIDNAAKIAVYTDVNSALSEPEKKLMALINGAAPQNESEEKEIKAIEDAGLILDIPSDWA